MKTKGARIADLLRLVDRHYEVNKLRSKRMVDLYIKNQLMPKLGDRVANNLRKSHVEDYKLQRKKEGASEVTINRELSVLRKAYTLGIEDEIIERKPPIKLYPEPEPREGHYEPEEYARWQDACRQLGGHSEMIADLVMFAYHSGWRLRECLNLRVEWVRLLDKIAVLPKQFSKNKRVKIYPLEGKVLAMIEKRIGTASAEGLLFHRNGRPIKNVTRLCEHVCSIIGVDSKHFFHNLRRSCTTNLNRAGVDKETGKRITGHRTDSIYHNYNQHTVESVRLAVKKVEEYLEKTLEEKQTNGVPENLQEIPEANPELEQVKTVDLLQNTYVAESDEQVQATENTGFFNRLWRILTKKGEITNA